jgi:hypothetical protein
MNLVEARKLFWPADQVPRGSVYAIVDAARDPEIETYLSALGTKEISISGPAKPRHI